MKTSYLLHASIILALVIHSSPSASAKSTIEHWGDMTQVIVPAYALGMAMQEDDWEGALHFGYSFAAMQASVIGLKFLIHEERPDGSNNRSFPSGHTAAAFSGATFIHKRYGIERAIVPYALAGFTGYSRVYAKKHYWHDVVAGAAISGLFTWIFVDDYHNNVQLLVSPNSVAVEFKMEF